jgi:hypothetical protein
LRVRASAGILVRSRIANGYHRNLGGETTSGMPWESTGPRCRAERQYTPYDKVCCRLRPRSRPPTQPAKNGWSLGLEVLGSKKAEPEAGLAGAGSATAGTLAEPAKTVGFQDPIQEIRRLTHCSLWTTLSL